MSTVSRPDASTRLAGSLLLSSMACLVASAVIVVPMGLTLNPSEPAATLAAVHDSVAAHLLELGLDVLGWLALMAAGLCLADRTVSGARHPTRLAAGLLAAAGLAGLLHDAGNLAVTQLAALPADPAALAAARAALLVAKWAVNLAGLVWVAATALAPLCLAMPTALRRAAPAAALSGLAAVALPWTTGLAGPSAVLEQVGYLLHLPVMLWWAVLALRFVARPRSGPDRPSVPASPAPGSAGLVDHDTGYAG